MRNPPAIGIVGDIIQPECRPAFFSPYGGPSGLIDPNGHDRGHRLFQGHFGYYGLELFTAVATILTRRYRSITGYIDNNVALAAVVKGDSTSAQAARLISFMWYLAASFGITLWFERVSSALNIADAPSRGRSLPFPTPSSIRFDLPGAHYCLDYIRNILNNSMGSLLLLKEGDVLLTQYRH